MARTLDRSLLPPGSTGFGWGGEIYCPGNPSAGQDASKTYNPAGQEVEIPKDFPEDEVLRENLSRAKSSFEMKPLERTVGDDTADEGHDRADKGEAARGKGKSK